MLISVQYWWKMHFFQGVGTDKYLNGNKLKYEPSFCCHGFLLHWYKQLLYFHSSKGLEAKSQPRSDDAWDALLSRLSLAVYCASALTTCQFLYKQMIFMQSCCMPRPRRALGPWEVRRRKWMVLRSVPMHQNTSLWLLRVSPCHRPARQTLPPSLPSSSPHLVMRLKAKWLN